MPSLTHPRAVLRELRFSDLERWYALLTQPRVFEHTSWSLSSLDDLLPYLTTARSAATAERFALVGRDDDLLIGTAGFHTVAPVNRSAEIAYDLDPAVWGQGIARSACNALVSWAFEHVGLVRVQATTLVSNTRSQRVLDACGFEREGLLRRYRMVRGTPGDFFICSRLAPP